MAIERIMAELSAERAWQNLEHITEQIPTRLAGSENSRRMAEFARDTLAGYGLDSQSHQFPGLVSFPEPAQVRLLGPEARTIEGHTLGHSASTDGIEAELVYVASGAESDYGDRDVRGKITLSELSYSPARHEKAYIAWQRGSVAQIMMNWGDEHNTAVPFGSMKSAWGNPTPDTLRDEMPDLPCVGIARTEGLRLKALCERGPVRVWLNARADNGWKPLTMTTAESGTAPGREFMLLGGHMDSWFGPQATDNAAGNACIMELARVFHQYRDDLRRGLVTGLWMGHETGTMISSTRFADLNWDRLRRSCVGYVQIDQPAMTGTSVWHLHTTDDIQSYGIRQTRAIVGDAPIHWVRQQKNGDSSFFGVGLPGITGLTSFTDEEINRTALASLGWWHHSIHNTIDKVDRDLMALHLRVYANWLWGLMTSPILPYEYTPLGRNFAQRLEELHRTTIPGIDLDSVLAAARDFHDLTRALDAASDTWTARLAERPADGERAAALLNDAKIRLSRGLVPVASTVTGAYGQDRYGHAWQTQMIPTLVAHTRLAGYAPDSEEYQTWWGTAVRARNRVADALGDANRMLRETLAQLG